ncbi:hypothetical protein GQ53DRAFT_731975 [Thozetella sp. PMI_491]|nr:hypothetical protein GQ53DRAFT_731975 [Thozetella sp. PMI_491]
MARQTNDVCGVYFMSTPFQRMRHGSSFNKRYYLPQVSLSVHTRLLSFSSRTTLTQIFMNPSSRNPIPELRYTFPLYDGVSVVGFTCTINGDRVIRGVVQERSQARQTFDAATSRGQTAGLLEQLPTASDVFTTTLGNIPSGAKIAVQITYLGELKHDAEVDGIRFTIPTKIAPRYGEYPGELIKGDNILAQGRIRILVDAEMATSIQSIQSPSHPIAVTIGSTSAAPSGAELSLQKASATLSLETAELDRDFVLQAVVANSGSPVALLETHPSLPNQRAIMATLVPKFNLPSSRPEIVFVCDRSGSMQTGNKIGNAVSALHIFLKSLPVGVKFNICSFGSDYSFLFPKGSRTYDASSLKQALRHVDTFSANYGGTEIYQPLEQTIKQRYSDMDLEIFLLTDGEIWNQDSLLAMLSEQVSESDGRIRIFTLGIGRDASHSLIEGVARAGNGFAQSVADGEKMSSKVVRMLKASLTPHVRNYTLEINYERNVESDDDDFELVEKVMDALIITAPTPETITAQAASPANPISLFDTSADPDIEMTDPSLDTSAGDKYAHIPPLGEPKLLQAPFKIPNLFPFSRTSVYLILSPESLQRNPKSVTLRGVSSYGPLELEIPVTVLAEKGETIHQLAARKSMQELEEGRGWIYQARGIDGILLKDKHPGRFLDMVEREAVRLGVAFGVAGKWCNFVAVEETRQSNIAPSRVSPPSTAKDTGSGAPFFATASAIAPPSPTPEPSNGRYMLRSTRTRDRNRGSMNAGNVGPRDRDRIVAPMGSSASSYSGALSSARTAPRPGKVDSPQNDRLGPIVALQTFTGAWKWTTALISLLGCNERDVQAKAVQMQLTVSSSRASLDLLATALALAYLQKVLASSKSEWEMLAAKALGWMELQMAAMHGNAEELVEKAKALIKAEKDASSSDDEGW